MSLAPMMMDVLDIFDAARLRGLRLYQKIEHGVDAAFGTTNNPLRNLGGLGFLFFWVLLGTGFYLYAVLDTSVEGAFQSIDWLTREQWYLGGVVRSVHRYAADALLVVVLLHIFREFLFGHYRGFRRFSWLVGVPLVWFMYVSGVGGFWLNWDALGQFSAIATAELLDWLPFFSAPLTRNFLSISAVSDRLFSLLVFIHLGVPLLMIFGLWFHIQRLNRAAVYPSKSLTCGTLIFLLVGAIIQPVFSQGFANLAIVPSSLSLDWFYLFLHPLMYATSKFFVWTIIGLASLILLLLPALPLKNDIKPAPVAVVDPDHCSGCRRCLNDCPYAAITMIPHINGKPGHQQASVAADQCASCGICAGACPSSTPFRKIQDLVTGIDMPQLPVQDIRRTVKEKLGGLRGTKLIVFGCEHGVSIDVLESDSVGCVKLLCIGMLSPAFIEYALREGAGGVVIAGCSGNTCAFRIGNQWAQQRLLGQREPHLRGGRSDGRLCVIWGGAGEELRLLTEFKDFSKTISNTTH